MDDVYQRLQTVGPVLLEVEECAEAFVPETHRIIALDDLVWLWNRSPLGPIDETSNDRFIRIRALAAGAPVVAGGGDQRVIDLDDLRKLKGIADYYLTDSEIEFSDRIDALIAGPSS